MSSGLLALLDDVAGLAQVAAASLDDAAGQAAKAASKAAGVVIDDTAVTPRYVVGFAADRELPIIGKIALGSLRNKLLFLLPAALLLGAFAPGFITPLLMLGGLYLCYEGFEKIAEKLTGGHGHAEDTEAAGPGAVAATALEDAKVRSAIQTDFILSAEIMAITLANVEASSLLEQAFVLFVVGVGVTLGVYGLVALIVKADDVGVALARNERPVSSLVETLLRRERGEERGALDRAFAPVTRAVGRGLVRFVPKLLTILAAVGTAAMLWVGGGILLHGLEHFGLHAPLDWLHGVGHAAARTLPDAEGAIVWLVEAVGSAVLGIAAGAVVTPLAKGGAGLARRFRRREAASG
ncbi:MAG: DUF808 domain-containing protein [Alsobacter sp.]